MIEREADIAVIGAGFSGSLVSLLLKQIGLTSVLIDRGTHPRFAIGESSTPLANLIWEDLAHRYDLPRLVPLANYARWKEAYPEIVCGLKRGFSYFHHTLDETFQPRPDRANELLVAASRSRDDADTHWLRSDFDHFLVREAVAAGVPYLDNTHLDELTPRGAGWELSGTMRTKADAGEAVRVRARFLIDASGEGSFLAQRLGIGAHAARLKTRSRSLFNHFSDVLPWQGLYESYGGNVSQHPFPCDDAALHHVFESGWMWVLRFDNGVTSAGFSLDPERHPLDRGLAPEAEWSALLHRLPSVAAQFAGAKPIVSWRQTGRMQRRLAQSAGSNWAMLPNTATFLDPLHSTGNAFTLVGIERLMLILEQAWGRSDLSEQLARYDALVQTETDFLDGMVSGSFAGFADFERMIALSMFYFSAATWSEEERRAGRATRGAAFLSADHSRLNSALAEATGYISDRSISTTEFTNRIRAAIAPFNRIGLCQPERKNMYPYST
jgi:tetracycline 7-halogenase / FADH2 O2-dependent halogenase